MNPVQRFWSAPARGIQVSIWVLLLAVLSVAVVPMLHGLGGPAPVAVASGDTLVLAEESFAYPDLGREHETSAETDNPLELLPAYRWHSVMSAPEDLGTFDGPQKVMGVINDLGFAFAGWLWGLLLQLTNWALTIDTVTSFADGINGFFASSWGGLEASGLPLVIGMLVMAMATLRAARGKLNESVRMAISAFLVLALLQGLGGLASQPKQEAHTPGYTPVASADPADRLPAGSPAWLAVKGNQYVNQIAFSTSSVFGAGDALTGEVQAGSAWAMDAGTGGATCSGYVQRLYDAFQDRMALEGPAAQAAAPSLTMISFMWQRSMYDSFVVSGWSVPEEGARVACHYLERAKNVPAERQLEIATGVPGYEDVTVGAFRGVADKKPDQASLMAWAVCEDGSTSRSPWNMLRHFGTGDFGDRRQKADRSCQRWWTEQDGGGLTAESPDALGWESLIALGRDAGELGADGQKVYQVMAAFYGHNTNQRGVASFNASATAVLYAYAFGGPAIGAALSQFVLLFMMLVLPWTIMLLAWPNKHGGRSQVGMKLLRLTGMAFGGKIVFLLVLGFTVTIMSALFQLVWGPMQPLAPGATAADAGSSASLGTMFWSLVIPVAAIVVMRMLLKAVGLGNIMGLNGALGFATAAMKASRDGSSILGRAGIAGGRDLNGALSSKIGKKTRSEAHKFAQRRKEGAQQAAARKLLSRNKGGAPFLDQSLADKVRKGELSPWAAFKQQHYRNRGLSDAMAAKRANREISTRAASASDAGYAAWLAQNIASHGQGQGAIEAAKRGTQVTSPFIAPKGPALAAAVADRSVIEEAARERNAALRLEVAKHVPPGTDPAQVEQLYSTLGIESAGQALDRLAAAYRADGQTTPLTRAQVAAALESARASLPPALGEYVVAGATGLPPILAPQRLQDGTFSVPDEALHDPHAALAVLANPANFLDPAVSARQPRETIDAYQVRLVAAMIETGLMDPDTGAVPNLAVELGVDPKTNGWEAKALDAVQRLQSDGGKMMLEVTRQVDKEARIRINGVTDVHVTGQAEALRIRLEAETVGRAAEITADAGKLAESIAAKADELNVAVSDPIERGKAVSKLMTQIERESMQAFGELQAELIHLLRLKHELDDSIPPDVAKAAIDEAVRHAEAKMAEYRAQVARGIAAVKLAGREGDHEELRAVAQTVQAHMAEAIEDVRAEARETKDKLP